VIGNSMRKTNHLASDATNAILSPTFEHEKRDKTKTINVTPEILKAALADLVKRGLISAKEAAALEEARARNEATARKIPGSGRRAGTTA
jgi:hypothetical protein